MHHLERPTLASRASYARRFQEPVFWQPYLNEVLRRHVLPPAQAILGTGGTFPTFLVGQYVVKFFGRRFEGAECFLIERSLHTHVLPDLRLLAPRYVADGHLFETGWRWPYIVTTRLAGTAWHETTGGPGEWQRTVAAELGGALREVHAQECPDEPVWRRDVLDALRTTCAARHRHRRMLPAFLIDQIDDYLAPPSAERRLVHADLHGDHIFVRDGHLARDHRLGRCLVRRSVLRLAIAIATAAGCDDPGRAGRDSLAAVMSGASGAVLFDWRDTLVLPQPARAVAEASWPAHGHGAVRRISEYPNRGLGYECRPT